MIDENPFERVGYEFAGWSTNKDARPEDAWDYDHFAESGISEETALYAIWKPVSLTFTFDPSGGKFSNGSEDIYSRSDIQFGTFPSMDSGFLNPSRQGYTFDGWYDKNGGAKIDGCEVDCCGWRTSGGHSSAAQEFCLARKQANIQCHISC